VALFGSLTHSLSLYGALEAIFLGCEVHHLAGLSPSSQLEYLENKKIEILYVTPTQLRLMLSAKYQNYIIDSLRYVFIGGASIEQNTLMELSEIAPNAELKQFYGSSETSFITISDLLTPINSVGKAYPGVEIVLGDQPDTPVSLGETGRVWVRSPYLFSKYVGENSFNLNRFSDWVSPGELAKLDLDQNLFILGRIDRIFKIKDQAIIPEEIENYLLTKKDIMDAAVVKKNDVLRGNKAVAYIATSERLDIEKLKLECISSIPPLDGSFQIIELSPEKFPFLPSGKPDIYKLQQWDI
jgi:long-chain acyl-CoA synthetase